MAGGLFDFFVRDAMPHHAAALGVAMGQVPAETEALVLLILNALGIALFVVGALALALIELGARHGVREAGWAAALGITVASGFNAWSIVQLDSLFFVGPMLLPLMAWAGVLWRAPEERTA